MLASELAISILEQSSVLVEDAQDSEPTGLRSFEIPAMRHYLKISRGKDSLKDQIIIAQAANMSKNLRMVRSFAVMQIRI